MNTNKKNEEYYYPVKEQAEIIEKMLDSYGIKVRVVEVDKLPDKSILYKLEMALGTVISDIEKRKRELALALASSTGKIEIQAPIPGRALIGILVPKVNKVLKPNKEETSAEYPKTILGKVVNFISYIFSAIAVILSYTVEAFEKRKDIAAQLLILIIVPIVLTFIGEGKFNLPQVLDDYILLFITWILIIGIQQKHNDNIEEKKKDKK